MKYVLFLALFAMPAFANDGGIAAIKVSQIKMREYKFNKSTGKEEEVRRINSPYFKIMVEGEEADRLQKILPSERNVLTSMYPDLAKEFNDTFKSLGIYNNDLKSNGKVLVSSKVLTTACNSGELKFPEDGGKPNIVKRGQSNCVISINAVPEEQIPDYLGDVSKFDPAEVCQ